MEYLCAGIESFFQRFLQDRVYMIGGILESLGESTEGITEVQINMKRNLPNDLVELAQVYATFKGGISDESALRLLPSSIIPNVQEELERMAGTGETMEGVINGPDEVIDTSVNVAGTALNGAQVASLLEITQSVARGQIPFDTATEVLMISFPTISSEAANSLLEPLRNFKQKVITNGPDQATE